MDGQVMNVLRVPGRGNFEFWMLEFHLLSLIPVKLMIIFCNIDIQSLKNQYITEEGIELHTFDQNSTGPLFIVELKTVF